MSDFQTEFILTLEEWVRFAEIMNRPASPSVELRKLMATPAPWDAGTGETPLPPPPERGCRERVETD